MFKTQEQYYADTTHISSSMIRAYLLSPSYYKALYVDKTIEHDDTAAIIFGNAVDTLLTEGLKSFNKQYGLQVLKKDDPELYKKNKISEKTILTQTVYDKVFQVADKVRGTEAFKWLKSHKATSQVVLTGTLGLVKVKGRLDFLVIEGDTAHIIDLKTTQNVLPIKFHFHCLDYGYYIQACMYKQLVLQNYPDVKFVFNKILAVSKENWTQIATFIMNGSYVDRQMDKINSALKGISLKRFKDPVVGWDEAIIIGEVKEECESL